MVDTERSNENTKTIMTRDNVVARKSYAFALELIKAYKAIVQEHKEYILSKQLLRSGTALVH